MIQADNIVHLKKIIEVLEAEKVKSSTLEPYIMRLKYLESEQRKVST